MHNLTEIRKSKGLSQSALAEKIGVTRAGMSYIEKNSLNLETANKLASVLGVSVFEILGQDNFVVLPKTKKDKKYLLKVLKGM